MSNIIDRRLNPRDKTIKNRQKFIQRSRQQIKKAVKDAIDTGNIADIENGKVRVKVKGIDEPTFSIDHKSGDKKYVMPGNDQYVVGDQEEKQKQGQGQGGSKAGLGEGQDDFEFVLNQEEFLDFIFDDLELPDMLKKQMKDVTKVKPKRAGYTNVGNPSQLDVVRSLKNSMGRRIGLKRPSRKEIEELEKQIEEETDNDIKLQLEEELQKLKNRMLAIPWLDPFDVRYRNFTMTPQPMTQAVMFCVMDVSGSMGQREKDLAKRFFFFLYMFLRRKYEKVQIVFVKHHETAYEVNEEDFFHSKDSGGTVVSTALKLTKKIINDRYNVNDWNIYIAQASDGDNLDSDYDETLDSAEALMPLVQYFAYIEVKHPYFVAETDLWETYDTLTNNYSHIQLKKVNDVKDVWLVFKDLFTKGT